MKILILATVTILAMGMATSGHAQETKFRHGLGYIFAAPVTVSNKYADRLEASLGGGGEFQLANGLGVGAEVGAISDAVATFSVNPYFHFNRATHHGKLVPFITAGYTAAGNTEFIEPWFNVGGGVDYWLTKRIGTRLEIRDSVDTNHPNVIHYVGFRVGFAWR